MKKKTTDILSHATASTNPLQRQWYHLLLARKIGYQGVGVTDNNNNNNNNNNQSNGSIGKSSYSIICQERYREAFRRYNQRFRQEIKQLEAMQPSAIDAMRLHRTFSITTLWPPLHSKREINLTLQRLEMVLSVTERRRLQEILKYGPDSKRF